MKKIINGKVYSTETAECVAEYSNSGGWRDFSHYEEELYRKKTGEFFLHGQGGPMTRYAVSCGGNSWSGGEKIIPLRYEEAQKWAEGHLDADEYEEIFGEVVEDDSKTVLTLSVLSSTAERLRRAASSRGVSVGSLVDELSKNL